MNNKILIDTTILVDYFKYGKTTTKKNEKRIYNSTSAFKFIVGAIKKEILLCVSVVTIKELLQYPYISSKEEKRIKKALPQVCKILSITWDIALIAGELSRKSSEYRDSHIEDCYIAATAISQNIPLYTRNDKDFKYVKHPNLKVYVPYKYK